MGDERLKCQTLVILRERYLSDRPLQLAPTTRQAVHKEPLSTPWIVLDRLYQGAYEAEPVSREILTALDSGAP